MKLLIIALLGALIGYTTNVIAIKLLFRPIQPVTIFKFQGLIPKRRADIAKNIGEVVSQELLSIEEVFDQFIEKMDKDHLKEIAGNKIKLAISERLPAFIPTTMVNGYIDQFIEEKGDDFLTEVTEAMIHKATTEIKVEEIIEEKILAFDLITLERIIIDLAKKELRAIELLGGLLGFLIGIVQYLILIQL